MIDIVCEVFASAESTDEVAFEDFERGSSDATRWDDPQLAAQLLLGNSAPFLVDNISPGPSPYSWVDVSQPVAELEAVAWDSSEHPRDPDGRFAIKFGLDGSPRSRKDDPLAPGTVEKAGDHARSDGSISNDFNDKVQSALNTLDPQVAAWWNANSVKGIITTRDASGWLTFWRRNEYGDVTATHQPQIVVDGQYSAGQVAQAIVNAAHDDMWPTGIGLPFFMYRASREKPDVEFSEWRKKSYDEAAQDAAVIAEIHVGTIAGLTSAGDAVIAVHSLAENGLSWNSVIQALPLIGKALPMIGGAIILKIAGKSGGSLEVKIAKKTLDQLNSLPLAQRKAICKTAAKLNDAEAAAVYIAKEAKAASAIRAAASQTHHLATNKGSWGRKFKEMFKSVGLDVDDEINKMSLPAHLGRHTEKYHEWVHELLKSAIKNKKGSAAKEALKEQLVIIRRKLESNPRLPYSDGGL
jgi:hypothetical protein